MGYGQSDHHERVREDSVGDAPSRFTERTAGGATRYAVPPIAVPYWRW